MSEDNNTFDVWVKLRMVPGVERYEKIDDETHSTIYLRLPYVNAIEYHKKNKYPIPVCLYGTFDRTAYTVQSENMLGFIIKFNLKTNRVLLRLSRNACDEDIIKQMVKNDELSIKFETVSTMINTTVPGSEILLRVINVARFACATLYNEIKEEDIDDKGAITHAGEGGIEETAEDEREQLQDS